MISIFMGSLSDFPIFEKALHLLKETGVPFKAHVCSAHRSPEALRAMVRTQEEDGCKVFIAAAGGAAHLAGAIAAQTIRPVIGVPVTSKLQGLDSLLSTVQMPSGVPVATVAVDGAQNAVYLALQIIATYDEKVLKWLQDRKSRIHNDVTAQNKKLQETIATLLNE